MAIKWLVKLSAEAYQVTNYPSNLKMQAHRNS